MIETPHAMLEATPDDEEVFIGIAPEDASWYLRFRAEQDEDDERITGRMALILPTGSARAFAMTISGLPSRALVQEAAEAYYAKIIRSD